MTIKTFIEKAIEGGWEPYLKQPNHNGVDMANYYEFTSRLYWREHMLLDPKAWKAVGKVEGWSSLTILPVSYISNEFKEQGKLKVLKTKFQQVDTVRHHMHRMIDALAEGKTIEQYLETL